MKQKGLGFRALNLTFFFWLGLGLGLGYMMVYDVTLVCVQLCSKSLTVKLGEVIFYLNFFFLF